MNHDELAAIRERDAAMPEGYVLVPELVDRRALLAYVDDLQRQLGEANWLIEQAWLSSVEWKVSPDYGDRLQAWIDAARGGGK